MKPERRVDKAIKSVQLIILIGFYLLSIRTVAALLLQIMPLRAILLAAGLLLAGLATVWRPSAVLMAFVMIVPLLSGLQATKAVSDRPFMEAIFASIYLFWLPSRMALLKDYLSREHPTGYLVDLLSGMILVSLLFLLLRYPFDFVVHRLFFYPFGVQGEALHGIDASFTILQGLFLFRMLKWELGNKLYANVKLILSAHVIIILSFSLIQLCFRLPPLHWGDYGFKSPFSDIHCYGAYVSLLFFYFSSLFLSASGRIRFLLATLNLTLLVLVIYSGGNVTLFALVAVGMFLLALRSKKYFALAATLLFILLGPLFYMPSILSESPLPLARRYAKATDISKLKEDRGSVIARMALWDRAVSMIRQFPLTGTGIGTFYAESPSYHDTGIPSWARFTSFRENTHNYYLQMAAELGLPALAVFLSIVLSCYRSAVVKNTAQGFPQDRTLRTGLQAGLAAYLISMLTSHHLLVGTQQFLFWFIVASLDINPKDERI